MAKKIITKNMVKMAKEIAEIENVRKWFNNILDKQGKEFPEQQTLHLKYVEELKKQLEDEFNSANKEK